MRRATMKFSLIAAVTGTRVSAADRFTGTWKMNPAKTEDNNPTQITYAPTANGVTIQANADRSIIAKYDGNDYPNGIGNWLTVYRRSDHILTIYTKLNGTVLTTSTRTVSADGRQMTVVTEGIGPDGAFTKTETFDRIDSTPDNDAFLGTWREDISRTREEPPLTYTIKVDEDRVEFNTNQVPVVIARLDGSPYPQHTNAMTLSFRRINASTIEIVEDSSVRPRTTIRWELRDNVLTQTITSIGAGSKPRRRVQHFMRQEKATLAVRSP